MRISLLLALLMLTSCEETVQTENADFKVETLFTHEGITVYRFEDGYTRYFTSCGDTSWARTGSCGKNCTRRVPEGVEAGR